MLKISRPETLEGVKVLTAIEGIYRDGQVELLEKPEGLPETRVIVTFLHPASSERPLGDARSRMLSRTSPAKSARIWESRS
jgi:hypothetical protein